jgi:cell division protein FtsN
LEQELLASSEQSNATPVQADLPPVILPELDETAVAASKPASLADTNSAPAEDKAVTELSETAASSTTVKAESLVNELPKEIPVLEKKEVSLASAQTPAPAMASADPIKNEPPVTLTANTETKANVLVKANEIPRYYIVSGGFSSRANAYKLKDKLSKKGFDSKVIEPAANTNIYKVTMGDFSNLEEAKVELDKYKTEYGKDLWIFKY